MKKIILKIGGMTCSACSSGLEKHLNKQKGINKASVNLVLSQALIEYDEKVLNIKDFDKIISNAGFKNLGEYKFEEDKKDNSKKLLIGFFFLLIILMYVSLSNMFHFLEVPLLSKKDNPINYGLCLLILTIPFLFYGFDIIKSGIKNLIYRHPNMDTLVTLGVFTCFIYSTVNFILFINGNDNCINYLYFESSAMIIFFIKLGKYIDHIAKEGVKEAIKELVQITPPKAYLKKNDEVKEVTLDVLKKGDVLVCKPGDKVAVDGVIIKGSTHLDETFITGESMPVKKGVNSKVIAGSINLDGYIEYTAENIGKDSTVSEIVRLVLEASGTKAPIARLADIASNIFVPTVILIAILTLIVYSIIGNFNDGIISFVNVLVVACPCALGLATPIAIVISESVCAKNGIAIKSGEILENASKVDTIIFDKTGTLTYGETRIAKVINYTKRKEEEILKLVATIEKQSNHPLSKAFKDIKTDYLVEEFRNIKGIGLYGIIDDKEIYLGNNKLFDKLKIKNKYQKDEEELSNNLNSIIYVIINKKVVALIGVKDIIREDAKETINKLKKLNKNIILLSGDNEITAKAIAKELGIKNVIANVLPKEKEEVIKEEMNKGMVMMVGDGINDAPSLAKANIGVSIHGASDIAVDTADVILFSNDLSKINELINVSKNTVKVIKQNLFWAFFYNIIMIIIAIGFFKGIGISLSPMYASIAMVLSSLTVITNSGGLRK